MLQTREKAKLTPADLVCTRPAETFIWREEMEHCSYDHVSQTRRWTESEKIRELLMTVNGGNTSTQMDGDRDA